MANLTDRDTFDRLVERMEDAIEIAKKARDEDDLYLASTAMHDLFKCSQHLGRGLPVPDEDTGIRVTQMYRGQQQRVGHEDREPTMPQWTP